VQIKGGFRGEQLHLDEGETRPRIVDFCVEDSRQAAAYEVTVAALSQNFRSC
jgi:hypothetical protein